MLLRFYMHAFAGIISSSACKSLNRYTKGEHLIKYPIDHNPTVPVMSGNERKDKPHHLPTPRRSALASAKQKNTGHPSNAPTRAKNTCLLHGPGHSSEECKVLKLYSEKYAAQRPHKPKGDCSGGNPRRGKVVDFDDNTQEVNTMKNHVNPTPRKKK